MSEPLFGIFLERNVLYLGAREHTLLQVVKLKQLAAKHRRRHNDCVQLVQGSRAGFRCYNPLQTPNYITCKHFAARF